VTAEEKKWFEDPSNTQKEKPWAILFITVNYDKDNLYISLESPINCINKDRINKIIGIEYPQYLCES
jgi:hypothetical protein